MTRGRATRLSVHLTPAERRTLEAWQRSIAIPAMRARRGRIILLLATGMPISQIAARVDISRRFIYKWVERFQQSGVEGLYDLAGGPVVARRPDRRRARHGAVPVHFRFALGEAVRVYGDSRRWIVEARTYHEGRGSTWVQYLLDTDDAVRREYEADLEPWENTP